jgi:hypothetical protein
MHIEVLPALPPLSRPHICDTTLHIDRWLVLAYAEAPDRTQWGKDGKARKEEKGRVHTSTREERAARHQPSFASFAPVAPLRWISRTSKEGDR